MNSKQPEWSLAEFMDVAAGLAREGIAPGKIKHDAIARVKTVICNCGNAVQFAQFDETELQRRYNELLYAVASKHLGETRHQTALRYIREREDRSSQGAAAHGAST